MRKFVGIVSLITLTVAVGIGMAGCANATTPALPPCQTDEYGPEFPDCYWDADTMGNKAGTSFIIYDGELYYPTGTSN